MDKVNFYSESEAFEVTEFLTLKLIVSKTPESECYKICIKVIKNNYPLICAVKTNLKVLEGGFEEFESSKNISFTDIPTAPLKLFQINQED